MAARRSRAVARGRGPARGEEAVEAHPAVPVRALLDPVGEGLKLSLRAGEAGLDREITLARVQRPGLALTGYTSYLRYGRVQILGGSEIGYLRTLTAARRAQVLERVAREKVSCYVVTKGLEPPAELVELAESAGIPLLSTPTESTPFIKHLSAFLEDRLALRVLLHSVLMDVFGLGVLILGESGIGKSECGLELVDRGHRLVGDDVVEIKRLGDDLFGTSPDLTRNHMEVRGLGVINIKDLYGVSSIRLAKRVELVVQLERWEAGREYDRLGTSGERFLILGVGVPLLRMPVAAGRNLALLVEVAARNQLLKERGFDAARRLAERVTELIEEDATRAAAPDAHQPEARRLRRAGGG
jgi:HPr kinase/phosphorylase